MFSIIAKKIFGSKNDRYLKQIEHYISDINALESQYLNSSQDELKAFTFKWLEYFANNRDLSQDKIEDTLLDILPNAFAIVREASKRVLNMRHFDVQLIGGIVLHQGKISEMKTGEGKTLVATLPAYLNALVGKGVHVITVNDYLAKRDSEWMGKIYSYLGLKVGVIVTNISDQERQEAYNSHITYGTNNEFGFDYLRDNMKFDIKDYVQREHYYAIVDEVDSILIDEARTPLIISGPTDETTDKYVKINHIIKYLTKDKDFNIDEKSKTISLNDEGVIKLEKILEQGNLFDSSNIELLHHVQQALKANHLFRKDVDYVVKDGEVIIVDEFTGRLMPGRRYSDGLHQALEAKEGVTVEKENQTLATITFQNYFRMYNKLAGMTGTADTESVEFNKIYSLDVVVIPTNKPMIRKDHNDLIYKTEKEKFKAVIEEIITANKNGQPTLVGTISIEKSELLSKMLQSKGVKHNILNAKNHENEAFIIAQAGRKSAVTISTNMAGRGTDIVLGGNPEMLLKQEFKDKDVSDDHYKTRFEELKTLCQKEREDVIKAGGLYVIGTERHESRRIDNQLRGRSGRQGDPGASRFYVSLEDDLMRIFGGERISKIMDTLKLPEDEAIENKLITRSIENAQKKVEEHNFEIRKHLIDFDDVMNKQRDTIYSLRREILTSTSHKDIMDEFINYYFDSIFNKYIDEKRHSDEWDIEGLINELEKELTIKFTFDPSQIENIHINDLKKTILDTIFQDYKNREDTYGRETIDNLEKLILLHSLDNLWKEHLLNIDLLKEGIGLRGYAHQDPVRVYQKESFQLFINLLESIKITVVKDFFRVRIITEDNLTKLEEETKKQQEMNFLHGQQMEQTNKNKSKPVKRTFQKIGRNDLCPCGSGKKYKKCCGDKDNVQE